MWQLELTSDLINTKRQNMMRTAVTDGGRMFATNLLRSAALAFADLCHEGGSAARIALSVSAGLEYRQRVARAGAGLARGAGNGVER
ncbi:hypothetical protein EVAR_70226_1 [Eumeta japonica]|uniref:Uncharacterized protein n=1 Tax=Eumeta variegata TaxID=151549 RepID=A0A4C1SE92_EUMVA|nr:hypothetical protein EVAR_70226_1 [Eumeta japonica]